MSRKRNVTHLHLQTVLLVLIGLVYACYPSIVVAEGPTAAEYGVVLNLSGKQRMLSQKMSKEVMLIALDIETDKNIENLKATAGLFDKTLKGLRDGDADLKLPPTTNSRILKQIDKVESIWTEFNAVIQEIIAAKKVSKEQVATIATNNLELLKEMNKCVTRYEKDASKAGLKSDPGLAVTINLAGKQRMLTQKMSKEYLLIAYGHEVDSNKLNLLETYTLFERTLKGLLDGDSTLDLPGTTNEDIKKQLNVVKGLWDGFLPIISEGVSPATTSIPKEKVQELANANLPLLKEMNTAVGMYEKEAAK
ncbi:type IV pili methyl-accepting chemotaxis transducer N-terminal domain-containing protein [Desulfosediminicola flagellatus]|uniref:type IV pili methyl-accepting chemotaxis transducer N-terminal domain-containing protein n=1 Tax=Desulfosediminicola flagellatus TaxID=2569541 RepID=UPI0010AD7A03|nr:type IV pili methyl-accepting chemotaxis transducer N-terminal domain-containing protein [Desulfosediminicola flagellatus]